MQLNLKEKLMALATKQQIDEEMTVRKGSKHDGYLNKVVTQRKQNKAREKGHDHDNFHRRYHSNKDVKKMTRNAVWAE